MKASKMIVFSLGIMIAGLTVLVHGKINGIGNEKMIDESILTTAYLIALFSLEYLYLKIKKVDILFEINKNSIYSLKCKEA